MPHETPDPYIMLPMLALILFGAVGACLALALIWDHYHAVPLCG